MMSPSTKTKRWATTGAYTALRVGVGVVMTAHGWLKLQDLSAWKAQLASLGIETELFAYLAVAGELLGGIGLIVGLLTPLAAFGVLCTMAVAIFEVHWGNGLLAKNNGFELPMTLGLAAAYFMVRGSGPLGLDPYVRRLLTSESQTDAESARTTRPERPLRPAESQA